MTAMKYRWPIAVGAACLLALSGCAGAPDTSPPPANPGISSEDVGSETASDSAPPVEVGDNTEAAPPLPEGIPTPSLSAESIEYKRYGDGRYYWALSYSGVDRDAAGAVAEELQAQGLTLHTHFPGDDAAQWTFLLDGRMIELKFYEGLSYLVWEEFAD